MLNWTLSGSEAFGARYARCDVMGRMYSVRLVEGLGWQWEYLTAVGEFHVPDGRGYATREAAEDAADVWRAFALDGMLA